MSHERPPASPSATITTAAPGAGRRRPGWPEIIVGFVVYEAVVQAVAALLKASDDDVVVGLGFSALTGVATLAGFGVAVAMRVRSWRAVGVRRTTLRLVLLGAAAGLGAFVLSRVVGAVYVLVAGADGGGADVQDVYAQGATGGAPTVVLAVVAVGVLAPVGEELLWRGVVATALLRYGHLVGVVGSAVVFAAVHGLNPAASTAFVVGLTTAELLRRSGSIWPGVAAHVVNNLLGFGLPLLAAVAT